MAENNSIDPKHLYQSLKNGDKAKVMEDCYDKTRSDDERLKLIPTVNKDTILHLAICMRQQDIAKEIVKKCSGGPDDKLLMKKNALGNTVLHEAAATSMKSLVRELLQKAPALLSTRNNKNEMPLYTAAFYGQTDMFKLLAEKVDTHESNNLDLHLWGNKAGTTILHAAIHGEFFDLALLIAKRYEKRLVRQKDKYQMTGLQLLSRNPYTFRSGIKYGPIERIIYYCAPYENVAMDEDDSHKEEGAVEQNENVAMASHKDEDAVEQNYSDSGDETGACFTLQPRGQICTPLSSVNRSIWNVLRDWGTMKRIYGDKKRHESAFKLAKFLIAADFSWDSTGKQDEYAIVTPATKAPSPSDPAANNESGEALVGGTDRASPSGGTEITAPSWSQVQSPPTPLLIATSYGILEIVNEILKKYPLAVEHVSDIGENILHVAIMHRQLKVFHQVISTESHKSRLVRRIDDNGFTILHHVGNMDFYKGGTRPGPALQLQEELEWFEIVEKEVPPHYAMQLTRSEEEKKEETPKQYFCRKHDELLKEAREWLKRTAESCSTVAGLMATVAFAAAFTVPGGNDEISGTPLLLHSPFFLVFIITDALSLASSLTSLVMFLSILTSPYEIDDFRHSLPRKLILGFTFLFFSVAVTMLAFASTLILTISTKKSLTTTFIYCVAFLPVTMFALLQFPLYMAIQSVLPWHLLSVAFSKLKNNFFFRRKLKNN